MIKLSRLLTVLTLLASTSILADQQKSWCGVLGTKSFEIKREFLFYPPELEGDSWSPRNKNISYGCDAKLKSIVVEFYYPTMEAAGDYSPYDDPDSRHLQLALSSLPPDYSANMLDTRLQRTVPEFKASEHKEKKHGLFYSTGLDPVYKKSDSMTLWRKTLDGKTDLIVFCKRVNKSTGSFCHLNYIKDHIPAEIKIRFSYHLLPEWADIEAQADFLTESLHK
ncbi:hypothetical protein ALO95_200216 [Pseudomonas syringae pv. antirrhini]|uniref:hypothetical protein n=1 Tax=Pseudomonas syringae group genomosp. 3 TaxID=251701 RepID=UPI000F4043EF|nr:hypothetical protein [Pseudomonas syringae group genomosp. 3]RMP44338.1 hypothetical protein ALQ23_200080 [Pseudomonas syringae pv. antirrhini]RMW26011.1 hypothetical protein ALO95_200216 [Pseudomonas syringae pv. antirrhini]